jgi:hypothetical protein
LHFGGEFGPMWTNLSYQNLKWLSTIEF